MVSVGARLAHVAADGEGRVEAAVLQDDDEHRCGRGLAVGTGHHQRAGARHQSGQHSRAQDNRYRPAVGLHQLRIGLRDGGMGGDDRGRSAG